MSSLKAFAIGSTEPPRHQKPLLRLYSMRFCPYASRIRIILSAKKIPYEIININLTSKPGWFLAKNPQGKVPALEIDGNMLWESLIIADYLENAFPEPKLWTHDPLEKAKGQLMIDNLSKLIALCANLYKKDVELSAVCEEILQELNFYESTLKTTKRSYFSGDNPGMVDYMLWPFFELLESLLFMRDILKDEQPLWHLIAKDQQELFNWIKNMQNNPIIKHTSIGVKTGAQFYYTLMKQCPDFDLGL